METVHCPFCGAQEDVNPVYCLAQGWPRCCGLTMMLGTRPEVDPTAPAQDADEGDWASDSALVFLPEPPRTAPIQGVHGGGRGVRIPWGMHMEAYAGYARKYPSSAYSQSAERLAQRGGFGVSELNTFVPGWAERVAVDWLLLTCRAPHCKECARLTGRSHPHV